MPQPPPRRSFGRSKGWVVCLFFRRGKKYGRVNRFESGIPTKVEKMTAVSHRLRYSAEIGFLQSLFDGALPTGDRLQSIAASPQSLAATIEALLEAALQAGHVERV